MADIPAFIASKSFDLWNRHISQIKWDNLRHILMYQKIIFDNFEKVFLSKPYQVVIKSSGVVNKNTQINDQFQHSN